MGLERYQKEVERNFDEYRRNIEELIDGLMPRIKWPLSIIGFLMVVSGATMLYISVISNVSGFPVGYLTIIQYFVYTLIAFVGYMLIHRSTEQKWL